MNKYFTDCSGASSDYDNYKSFIEVIWNEFKDFNTDNSIFKIKKTLLNLPYVTMLI